MSANIEFNKARNKYSFISHKQPAWHNLGTIVDDAMTSKEALIGANLDFTVNKSIIDVRFPSDISDNYGEIHKEIPNKFATYRTDTLDVFGVVGSKYSVVQNIEAFKFMDSIVGEGKAIYETAGALGKGETVFITAKLPYYIKINGNDTIENYLVVSISHDGTSSVNIFLTPIRVVCQNTLALAKDQNKFMFKLRHTASIHNKITDASNILKVSKSITESTSELYNYLSKIKITDSEVDKYINNVFLTSEELQDLAKEDVKLQYSDAISTNKKNIISNVRKFYYTGIGQKDIIGTKFGAFSSVNGYLSNVKSYSNNSKKMASLVMGGTDYKLNTKALELIK